MEDQKDINIDGILPAPEFSGMAIPTGIRITPIEKPAEEPKPVIKLKSSETKRFKKLLYEENTAVAAAKDASRRRDLFCVDLERDYGLNGSVWTVDLEKGTITVTGKRPSPEKK